MSFPIVITFATPPDGTCPATFADATALLQTLVTGEVTATYTPYVMGADTPAVEDQDKAWIKLDASGRPAGTFVFYAGNWRRTYTGLRSEVTMFGGNPSLFFDSNGRGLVGGEWDGWHIANGLDGTPNLTDKFIVAAHMDNSDGDSGYGSGQWRTKVSGGILATGGAAEVTLADATTYRPARDEIRLDKFTADGNARSNSGALLGHYSGTHDPDGSEAISASDAGNPDPDPIPTLPPYYALAYVVFLGYL